MRILVGTDGSDQAIEAAARGVKVLADPDVITVVCVVPAPAEATAGMESGFAGGMASTEVVDAAWVAVKEDGEAALDRTAAGLPSGTNIERRLEVGDPGPTIVRLANELAADAVVVGSRGRGAIKRALLGSVSTHVTNNASCPVVVVGEPD
jgi:nucleotide-binding universal stress UspA family protein